jgi:homoserine dehydrogenase
MRIGIIGYGRIGKEVKKRVLERGWEISLIVDTSGIYNSEEKKINELKNWQEEFEKQNSDVVLVAIPTLDDGKTAYCYIKRLVEMEIPVVTTEKGALSNYFQELKPYLGMIGYTATVGGGTRMLHWLKERVTFQTKEIHLIINGTLNYIFDGLSKGRTLDEVVEEAKKLGYAEPGAETPLEVINTEACKDIPMKIAVVLNICGFGEVRARDIKVQRINELYLKKLIREATFRRYIVSITKEENEEDVIGGFKFRINQWWISGGFKNRTQNPLFFQLVPPGVNNAALVYGSDGVYILTGPGAGATPTVMGAVMRDIDELLKLKKK